VAASFLKSGVEVSVNQFLVPAFVLAVHVTPLSLVMYTFPWFSKAAILRKSGEATTPKKVPDAGLDIVTILEGYDPAGVGLQAEFPDTLL
jgi:hypothetical protein